MKKTICFGIVAVFCMSISSVSFAKFTIVPSISVREEYNDNIFLTGSDEEDDFITTVSPRVELEYFPNQSLELSLDYAFNLRYFNDHDDLKETSLSDSQYIDFKAKTKPLSRIFIDISDVYGRVPIDVREKTAIGNDFSSNMTDNNRFSVSPYTILPVTSTITTTIGYEYGNVWYRDAAAVDYENHSAFLILNKKFTSRINGEVKYELYAYRPDAVSGQNQYDRHNGSVALFYQIRPEFQVRGEFGQAWFDYEILENQRITFFNIGTDYILKIAQDTSLSASYGTDFRDSNTAGPYQSHRFDLNFEAGKVLKLSVNPYHLINTFMDTDREDKIGGVSIDISRPLTQRLDILLDGLWENHEYLPQDEKVRRYSLGSSLDYTMSRNITTGIGYRYNERDSDGNDDFQNNIVWLQAKVIF